MNAAAPRVLQAVRNLLALAPPRVAPAMRILLCTYLAVWRGPLEARSYLRDVARDPLPLVHDPLFDALGIALPLSGALPILLVVLCATSALGIATRLSLFALFAVWLPIGTLDSGFGYFNHTPALPAQIVLALAVAPGTTAWSLDRFILARIRRQPVESAPLAPRFGDVVLLVAVSVVYFASGVAKLRWGGLSWLDGSTLAFYLREQQTPYWFGDVVTPGVPGPSALGPHAWKDGFGDISGYTYLSSGWGSFLDVGPVPAILSWFTIVVEVGAPLALLAAWRVRATWCVLTAAFHVSIVLLVGPGFLPWIVVVAGVFPWHDVRDWVRARRAVVGRARAARSDRT